MNDRQKDAEEEGGVNVATRSRAEKRTIWGMNEWMNAWMNDRQKDEEEEGGIDVATRSRAQKTS
jgi:uncharacterized protein YerC